MAEVVLSQTTAHADPIGHDFARPRRAKSWFRMPTNQARLLHELDRFAQNGTQALRKCDRTHVVGVEQADEFGQAERVAAVVSGGARGFEGVAVALGHAGTHRPVGADVAHHLFISAHRALRVEVGFAERPQAQRGRERGNRGYCPSVAGDSVQSQWVSGTVQLRQARADGIIGGIRWRPSPNRRGKGGSACQEVGTHRRRMAGDASMQDVTPFIAQRVNGE